MENQPVAEIEVISQACPQGLIDYMSGLEKAGILDSTFQRTLASLATNAEGLKAVMNSADFQSAQAALAVDAVSRALSELPAERLNLLSSTLATVAKSLVAQHSDKDVSVGGQSTIPVSFTVDLQRTVVSSEQIAFDVQRIVANSEWQPSAAEELQERLSKIGKELQTALRVRLSVLIMILLSVAEDLKDSGHAEECYAAKVLAFLLIWLISPQDR